jgi:hexokinase
MKIQQLQQICQNVLDELKKAADGEKTGFAFLRNFVPTPFVKDNEVFQVLVVGGSICRNAVMKRQGKIFNILRHTEKDQPIFHTEKDFLAFLALEIDTSVTHIALNFAFPIQPTIRDEKLDGTLLYGTKEHTFEGLQGKQVGQRIEEYIQQTQHRTIHVCTANDTICLLLSGLINYSPSELACAIVGTGYNVAFFLSEHEAVNLEAGGFDKLPKDAIEQQIDKASSQPGMQVFEKQTAGAYLYQYFNLLLKKEGIPYPEIPSTKSLDALAREDNEIGEVAKEVLQKSAHLVACQIASIAAYKNSDLICVVEGSLFWKGWGYKEAVMEAVEKLAPDKKIRFVHIENSSVLGAAKLIA